MEPWPSCVGHVFLDGMRLRLAAAGLALRGPNRRRYRDQSGGGVHRGWHAPDTTVKQDPERGTHMDSASAHFALEEMLKATREGNRLDPGQADALLGYRCIATFTARDLPGYEGEAIDFEADRTHVAPDHPVVEAYPENFEAEHGPCPRRRLLEAVTADPHRFRLDDAAWARAEADAAATRSTAARRQVRGHAARRIRFVAALGRCLTARPTVAGPRHRRRARPTCRRDKNGSNSGDRGDPGDDADDDESAGDEPPASGEDDLDGGERGEFGFYDSLMRSNGSGAPGPRVDHRSTLHGLRTSSKQRPVHPREIRECADCGAHLRQANATSYCWPCTKAGKADEAAEAVKVCGCGCGTSLEGLRADADFVNDSHSKRCRRRLQRERQQSGMAVAA